MLKLALAIAVTGLLAATASAGVTGPAFYVDGQTYRTVNTPTDLSGTGAPAHSFDTIYDFGGNQLNVATAAPGDRGYNGGRYGARTRVPSGYAGALATGDVNDSGAIDSDEELAIAMAAGTATDYRSGQAVRLPGDQAAARLVVRNLPALRAGSGPPPEPVAARFTNPGAGAPTRAARPSRGAPRAPAGRARCRRRACPRDIRRATRTTRARSRPPACSRRDPRPR